MSPISSGNKRTTFKSLIDQVRIMKESHAFDITLINAEMESIKDDLANVANSINGTNIDDRPATCTAQFQK